MLAELAALLAELTVILAESVATLAGVAAVTVNVSIFFKSLESYESLPFMEKGGWQICWPLRVS